MYLTPTDKIEVLLSGAVTTNQLPCVASWQDITSLGMTLPMSASQVVTNNTTVTDFIVAPSASTTRQVTEINIYNNDTVAATITVQKDVSGTNYLLTKCLLQAGDTLYWSRESGWTILKVSSQESVIITSFIANGTWTKPAGLKRILGVCVGAGGGGGSGRQGAAGENRYGGGAGGGGNMVWRNIAAADISATVAVTVGTGGTGGAAQASTSTNGNAGTAGAATSFGALIIANGGGLGAGGTTAAGSAGSGGANNTSTPANGPYSLTGATGGAGGTNAGGTAATTANNNNGAAGGGGGGGINNSNVSATTGGNGGAVYQNGVSITGPTSSAVTRPDGANNASIFLFFSNTLSSAYGLGTGGAGGYPGSASSGAGGYGGNYGAGGGGGTATLNGTSSGRGGDGAGGLCLIMEIY